MPLDKSRPKTPKRVMEKKRRARINDSLIELKNIVLQATNRNNPRHSKLEKADILEMTVKYLRSVHVTSKAPVTSSPIQYRSGYTECMREVQTFLNNTDASPTVRLQLLDHLSRSGRVSPSTPSVETGLSRQSNTSNPPCVIQSMNPALPDGRIQIQLSQAASTDSTKSVLVSGTVQSSSPQATQPTRANSPLKLVNIKLPVLSKTHIQTFSPPPPPSVPLSSPPIPPPPLSSKFFSPKEEQAGANITGFSSGMHGNCQVRVSEVTNGTNAIKIVPANASQPTGLTGVIRMSRTEGGYVAVVLPQSALPGGKLPTHLIPVYDPPVTPNHIHSHDLNVSASSYKVSPSADSAGTPIPLTTTVLSSSIPLSNSMPSPCTATVAPHTWYTRPAFLTTNVEQVNSVFAGQAPVTINLPIQARIVQNLIPIQAASISPILSGSVNHIPVRLANLDGQGVRDDGFMWRPW